MADIGAGGCGVRGLGLDCLVIGQDCFQKSIESDPNTATLNFN